MEKDLVLTGLNKLNTASTDLMKYSWMWKKRWRDLNQHTARKSLDMKQWEENFFELMQVFPFCFAN